MKQFYLALICLLGPLLGHAQSNFKKAYVVSSPGDTLRGFVDYQELGGREPRTLAFKSAQNDKDARTFTPANSRQVDIEGLVTYQSFQGRISQDAVDLKNLPHEADSTKRAADIFLRVLQKGKNASLYTYTDEIKTRYFLQLREGNIKELGFKKYYYNQTSQVRTLKHYIGQLWFMAIELHLDTPALKKKIERAQYTSKDLLAIVSQLNGLNEQQQNNQQGNTRVFAGLGISQTVFTVEGKHALASNSNSKDSYLPKISLGMDVFQNRDIQKFFFRGELILHAATADISGKTAEYSVDRTFNQTLTQPTLTLAPQLGYNFYNRDNLKFNLGLGASFNFSTYSNNYYHTTSTYRSSGQQLSDRKIKGHHQFTAVWFAIPVRAGLVLNQKTDISLLYFMSTSITRYVDYSFSRSSLQLGLNYLFNK